MHEKHRLRRAESSAAVGCLLLVLLAIVLQTAAQEALPDAPAPKTAPAYGQPALGTCRVRNQGATMAVTGAMGLLSAAGLAKPGDGSTKPVTIPCPLYVPIINWYARFMDGPKVKPLTPKEKAWLAVRNVGDPFNALTILGTSAISTGSDAHSVYGPGMSGFGRLVGTSYAEDMTGEFLGTFLLPTLTHQDPHYHRAPSASISRRILHAATSVVWTQGDDGHGMLNYSNLIGSGGDIAISNLYVPGRETNGTASLARYGTGLALSPTENLITEFLPDLARHIHFRVVFVQRIIDQVAKPEAGATP